MKVTRFAPSPTGYLHLGHAFAALTAAASGDEFHLRIEDLDQGRTREEFVAAIFEDLRWLGLHWKEPVLRQSGRLAAYRHALDALEGLTYPCFCTRKEIAEEIAGAIEAPHLRTPSPFAGPRPSYGDPPLQRADAREGANGPDGPLYPGTCRHLPAGEREARMARGEPYALRLDAAKAAVRAGALSFEEHGETIPVDPLLFGDLVLARKDVPASYHLAVVVDDAFEGVNLVTRGEDLLAATHPQRLLQALLGLPAPAYAHHKLILDEQGRKFSKRDGSVTLKALREGGATAAQIRARFEFG
jgi:glutamyl-Q tRNA(Asp) synthetase